MDPRRPTADKDSRSGIGTDALAVEEQDWDDLEAVPISPDSVPGGDELVPDVEREGELPEEDDDNPDQESDEALPDDEEEQSIRRDMSGRGVRYEPE